MVNQINVLVVDDSAFMRKSITLLLESDPQIKVIDTARDGKIAVDKIKNLKPDVVTLDVEMPNMDGLEALEIIMKEVPTPVIMVSSLTQEGAETTIKALELGAVDFIPKEMSFVSVAITGIREELIKKVKAIHKNKSVLSRLSNLNSTKPLSTAKKNNLGQKIPFNNYRAIGIGISTGGPISLQKVIPLLSSKIRIPIFIVQHMPPKFTASLADRLNSLSPLEVKEAEKGEVVRDGVVYIAPGGYHMTISKDKLNNKIIDVSELPENMLHRPSVDVMLESVKNIYGNKVLGIIMTGMGKDGLEGIKKIKAVGGYCLAQDEESSVVYGMPRAIVENGLADVVASLEDIPKLINQAV